MTKMIKWLKFFMLVSLCVPLRSSAETAKCLKVYHDGGALAVLQSRDCPLWIDTLSWAPYNNPSVLDCSEALMNTLRQYFGNDHIVCDVDFMLPYLGLDGIQKEAPCGIVAVFHGLKSNENSDMAWEALQGNFFLHTHFLFNGTYFGRLEGMSPDHSGGPFHVKILKEALLRSIHDIDLRFPMNGYTATVILMVDDQIFITSFNGSDKRIAGTSDGSYSGQLAASRSVCEVSFARLGVTSSVNVTDGHLRSSNGSRLEATSYIRQKKLNNQDLCDALQETYLHERSKVFSSCLYLGKRFNNSIDKCWF